MSFIRANSPESQAESQVAECPECEDETVRPINIDEMKRIEVDILRQVVKMCTNHGLKYYIVGGTLLGAVRHHGFIPWDDDIDIALPRPDYEKLEHICRRELPPRYKFINFKDDPRLPYNFSKVIDTQTVLIEEVRKASQVRLGVYVDIFPFDGVPRNRLAKAVHMQSIRLLQTLLLLSSLDISAKKRSLSKRIILKLVQFLLCLPVLKSAHWALERLASRYDIDSSGEICNYMGAWGSREVFPCEWLGEGVTLSFEGLLLNGVSRYDEYLTQLYGDYLSLPPPDQRRSHHRYRAWHSTDCERIRDDRVSHENT